MKARAFLPIVILVLGGFGTAFAQNEEEIILTTYYPAPDGEYDHLTANELTVTRNANLAVGSGNVGIGTSSPQAKLDVFGDGDTILLPRKTTAGDPATGIDGMMYYNSNFDAFRVRQNGTWNSLAVSNVKINAAMPCVAASYRNLFDLAPPTSNDSSPPLGAWQTVSTVAFTGGVKAKAIIARVICFKSACHIRPKGSNWPVDARRALIGNRFYISDNTHSETTILPLDANGELEWSIHQNDNSSYGAAIYLIGWIE